MSPGKFFSLKVSVLVLLASLSLLLYSGTGYSLECEIDEDCGEVIVNRTNCESAESTNVCSTQGTRIKYTLEPYCNRRGECAEDRDWIEEDCEINTDGISCNKSWTTCGSYSNVCDEETTKYEVHAEGVCSGGSCSTVSVTSRTPIGQCFRDTDGVINCGPYGGGVCFGGRCTGDRPCASPDCEIP